MEFFLHRFHGLRVARAVPRIEFSTGGGRVPWANLSGYPQINH
jgi:hypothetical protein